MNYTSPSNRIEPQQPPAANNIDELIFIQVMSHLVDSHAMISQMPGREFSEVLRLLESSLPMISEQLSNGERQRYNDVIRRTIRRLCELSASDNISRVVAYLYGALPEGVELSEAVRQNIYQLLPFWDGLYPGNREHLIGELLRDTDSPPRRYQVAVADYLQELNVTRVEQVSIVADEPAHELSDKCKARLELIELFDEVGIDIVTEARELDLICPITQGVLIEPVCQKDDLGQTYEHSAFLAWHKLKPTDPKTRRHCTNDVVPNEDRGDAVDAYLIKKMCEHRHAHSRFQHEYDKHFGIEVYQAPLPFCAAAHPACDAGGEIQTPAP